MLDALFSAPTDSAQSLIEKHCPDCGSAVFGRTKHKQLCEGCKRSRKLESYKSAAERQRRKKGIKKVKGESFACEACGQDYVATSKSRQKWCPDCKPQKDLERAREQSRLRGENPERREKFNQWYRERAKNDPLVALSRMMRALMYRELGRKKDTDRCSWYELVGYTASELKEHLERQFLPGMTWENRGANGWHIDHVVPIASFNYDSPDHADFKACWALTNLRPLWAGDNIRKKDKRLFLI